MSKINYKNITYYYLIEKKNNSKVKFIEENDNSLVKITDEKLIQVLLPLFYEQGLKALKK